MDEAANQEKNLCIHLRFTDVPELADLPWEYLYNPPPLSQFFALSAETPIVRYLDWPRSDKPLKVQLPLRVLVMIANPQNYDQFDANNHWTKIKEALDELVQDKLVALDRLDTASLDALQQQLRWDKYHIFHFVGHGGFDKEAQDGVLVLEDETGQGHVVPGKDLGMLLKDHPSLKLAVLNTCQGAHASRTDPFAGTAQSLMQQGLLAVLGMQSKITDKAAIFFDQAFYEAMADGYPVDAALTEARKSPLEKPDAEWGIPVLYMRSSNRHILRSPMGDSRRAPTSSAT